MTMSTNKVAIVTGGNKGIGFGIVKNLCKQFDGTVYLTARDVGRGEAAVEEIKKAGLKAPVFHKLDIESTEDIKTFAEHIKKTHGGIDVLVNNAAIAFENDPLAHQAEATLKVNYFSLINVCDLLFPLLRPHARVVNLSSAVGHLLCIPNAELREKFADPNLTEKKLSALMNQFIADAKSGDHVSKGWPANSYCAYCVSKVGVSALTRVQHNILSKDSREDIIINHVHPGYVDTDMTKHLGPLTIEQGADAPTYLALLPENTTSPKGCYVWYTREICDWVKGPTPSLY